MLGPKVSSAEPFQCRLELCVVERCSHNVVLDVMVVFFAVIGGQKIAASCWGVASLLSGYRDEWLRFVRLS